MNNYIKLLTITFFFGATSQHAENRSERLTGKQTKDCKHKCIVEAIPDYYSYNPANYDKTSLDSLNRCLRRCEERGCSSEDYLYRIINDVQNEIGEKPKGLTPEQVKVYKKIDSSLQSLAQCHYLSRDIRQISRVGHTCTRLYFQQLVTEAGAQYNDNNSNHSLSTSTFSACLELPKDQQAGCREYQNSNYYRTRYDEAAQSLLERERLEIKQRYELSDLRIKYGNEIGDLEKELKQKHRQQMQKLIQKQCGKETE